MARWRTNCFPDPVDPASIWAVGFDREPNCSQLATELKKPDGTLLIMWEESRAVHPDGYGYSRFAVSVNCNAVSSGRLSPSMRQELVAGEKVFVDYSGKKIAIVNPSKGEFREAEIFVAVLGASGYTSYDTPLPLIGTTKISDQSWVPRVM